AVGARRQHVGFDALRSIAVDPVQRHHFPDRVRRQVEWRVERKVETDETLAVRFGIMAYDPPRHLDLERYLDAGLLARIELREHGPERAKAAPAVESGVRCAQGPRGEHEPVAAAVTEVRLEANGRREKQIHGGLIESAASLEWFR